MRIHRLPAARLTPDLVSVWSRLQQADRALESPYFRPEFTQAVAAVRDDVEVAVLEEGGEPVGFLPFQRSGRGTGRPVGGRMSDFQGLIVGKDIEWDAAQLLRGCGLTSWEFDHLVAQQQPFAAYHDFVAESPYLDLSDGFESYRTKRRQAGSIRIKRAMQRSRKMARALGPIRLERHETDPRVFETLVGWKTEQYRRTKVVNVFGFDWTVSLLRRVLQQQSEAFSGMISALYAGDRLAAIGLGIRSRHVFHLWFTAYDRELAACSPGLVLMVELAKAAEQLGIRHIHLGQGPEEYKRALASDSVAVAEGTVECSAIRRGLRRSIRGTREWIRHSPLERPVQVPITMIHDFRNWLAFR